MEPPAPTWLTYLLNLHMHWVPTLMAPLLYVVVKLLLMSNIDKSGNKKAISTQVITLLLGSMPNMLSSQ